MYDWTIKGTPWDDTEADDMWTGGDGDAATVEEAIAQARAYLARRPGDRNNWVCITDGDGDLVEEFFEGDRTWREEQRHREVEAAREDDAWRREQAMQAGMAFGCQGYNDYYGY